LYYVFLLANGNTWRSQVIFGHVPGAKRCWTVLVCVLCRCTRDECWKLTAHCAYSSTAKNE